MRTQPGKVPTAALALRRALRTNGFVIDLLGSIQWTVTC